MKNHLVRGLKLPHKPDIYPGICDACELGQKKRSTFKPSERLAVKGCNSSVHSDICGPIDPCGLSNERYVLIFVDVHSRHCCEYLLQSRAEYFHKFLQYKSLAETQHNTPLIQFISDNGGEYVSTTFKDYCEQAGIRRDTTIPYTPEQNGMAEVRFRILFAKARTMLIDASLPKQFWPFAVQVAVYVYNRTLCVAIQHTPFESWHDYPPDVSNLHWFGCLCLSPYNSQYN